MSMLHPINVTRSTIARASLALAAPVLFVASSGMAVNAATIRAATPSRSALSSQAGDSGSLIAMNTQQQAALPTDCSTPTPAETEGPYFKAGSPEESALATAGTPGTQLTLSGYVLDTNCQPVAGALVDFWQANAAGQYDNSGYTLRGHQFTDANGFYQVETMVPGLYPGRTRHIHVKVQAPGQPAVTTQLYFPNEPGNARDGIFQENGQALLVQVQQADDSSIQASYTFIVVTQ